MTKNPYNKTQLSPDALFERHVYHRDHLAHYLRWNYVMRQVKPGTKIMDIGCGDGGLLDTLYHNRRTPAKYLGIDVREQTIKKTQEKWKDKDWAHFCAADLCGEPCIVNDDWDFITCFEVLEHVGKQRVPKILDFVQHQMTQSTIAIFSTPCYDERVGAADNHMIEGEVGELTRDELKALLEERFTIVGNYGTFASVRDYKPFMDDHEKAMYDRLSAYYDANIISILFAPLHPEHSRNNVWMVKRK